MLPLPCSGGASAGAFGFPQKALERPRQLGLGWSTGWSTESSASVRIFCMGYVFCLFFVVSAELALSKYGFLGIRWFRPVVAL